MRNSGYIAAAIIWLVWCQPASAQLINENLLAGLPPGYKIGFNDRKGSQLISEMVPQNETVENWTEMVTVQIFFGLKVTPAEFKARIEKGWAQACPGGEPRPVYDRAERGYATLTWVMACPLNPKTKKPEITWFKAIQGNDSFYVVQKAFKFMPSQDQATQWLRYLNDVAVCDSRLADRACPRTKG
jgi:hypothetical protein